MKIFYTATIKLKLERDINEEQLKRSDGMKAIKKCMDDKLKKRLRLELADGAKEMIKIKSLTYVQEI